MLTPFNLKNITTEHFLDPLKSHQCKIEEQINEITETWGGYEEPNFEIEVPSMRYSKVSVSYDKINRILGIKVDPSL